MGSNKLRGKDLRKIDYPTNSSIALAINIMAKHYKYTSKDDKIKLLNELKNHPEQYINDPLLSQLAYALAPDPEIIGLEEIKLLEEAKNYSSFGKKLISENAFQQMELAMRLPITEMGALMPDAHHGYGLPIGGVLATDNVVIPYGVGVDIGCRMSLSIYDIKEDFLKREAYKIKLALKERTNFGTGGELKIKQDHAVLDRGEFKMTDLLKGLHIKAARQLGTSGSGNHFVEFGLVNLEKDNGIGMEEGNYLGILAHSGSRGLGANIAKEYTAIAVSKCPLPRQAQHLAWLDLDSEAGQEYWLSMNLAGDYAKACHDQIHYHLAKYLDIKPVAKIENHHNFAWKEEHNGKELIVHRKGATPAAKDVLGIIPGSMTATGYIVKGLGNEAAIKSAAHGAGRRLSRSKAKKSYTGSELKKVLKREGVILIGGGIDEAPIAYKNIEQVMLCQKELVTIIGEFKPKIVRMDRS